MTTLTTLPFELIEEVASHAPVADTITLRLTSRVLAFILTRRVFRAITIRGTSDTISTRLSQLSGDLAHLAPYIQDLVVYFGHEKDSIGAFHLISLAEWRT
jgi:hypothetical protein